MRIKVFMAPKCTAQQRRKIARRCLTFQPHRNNPFDHSQLRIPTLRALLPVPTIPHLLGQMANTDIGRQHPCKDMAEEFCRTNAPMFSMVTPKYKFHGPASTQATSRLFFDELEQYWERLVSNKWYHNVIVPTVVSQLTSRIP